MNPHDSGPRAPQHTARGMLGCRHATLDGVRRRRRGSDREVELERAE